MAYGGALHVNKVLSNLAVDYAQSFMLFKDFPVVDVNKESDVYHTFAQQWRIPQTIRANKSPANTFSWNVSTSSYYLDENALKDLITDRDKANVDTIDLNRKTVEFLTEKIMVRSEYNAAATLFTTGSWSQFMQGDTTTSWRYNTTTSAPITNVLSATSLIMRVSGVRPNTLILGEDVFIGLKTNTNVYSRIQYVERAIPTADILAAMFDLDKVIVGYTGYDTSEDGLTSTFASIWGQNALLCYLSKSASLKDMSAFKVFRRSDMGLPVKVKTWRDEELAGDWIEVGSMAKVYPVATLAGYYFSSITST